MDRGRNAERPSVHPTPGPRDRSHDVLKLDSKTLCSAPLSHGVSGGGRSAMSLPTATLNWSQVDLSRIVLKNWWFCVRIVCQIAEGARAPMTCGRSVRQVGCCRGGTEKRAV